MASSFESVDIPSGPYITAVDVGATNTRVALHSLTNAFPVIHVPKAEASNVTALLSFLSSLSQYLASKGAPQSRFGCLAAAGPVLEHGHAVVFTNYIGERDLHVRDLPEHLFPRGSCTIINDLEAAAYGYVSLLRSSQLSSYFNPLSAAQASATWEQDVREGTTVVLAAGTGLGAGLVVADNSVVVPGEGGHMSMRGESELTKFASHRLYEGKFRPEYEDLCSGRGLVLCYQYECGARGVEAKFSAAGDIAKAALTGEDAVCVAALRHMNDALMECAQQMSLTVFAKTVVLLGDNQVSNDPFFVTYGREFRNVFENHPKKEWLSKIVVLKQHTNKNLNLLGAAFVAQTKA
jgi:glucokinase